ncbi:uncharacterized protein NPIL_662861 [Nephila pilipes]|uniref:Uncharacterized protein n=1 Tax=Nephila pilipes TaxID=299642 RepID=A0A8X6QRF4_NEPPI|nr:uncharacterized protein NPIL_662861 [Nephila pilipes]
MIYINVTSIELSNTLDSVKTDCDFVSGIVKMSDIEGYNFSVNKSILEDDQITVNCITNESTIKETRVKVSECLNDEEDNFSVVNRVNTDSEKIAETPEIIVPNNKEDNIIDISVNDIATKSEKTTETFELVGFDNGENNCSLMSSSVDAIVTDSEDVAKINKSKEFCNDEEDLSVNVSINKIVSDSGQIAETSEIITSYDKEDMTIDISINDIAAKSEKKPETFEFVGFDNGKSNCSLLSTSIDVIVTDSENVDKICQSTILCNNEDDLTVDVSNSKIASDSEQIAETSKCGSLVNKDNFTAKDPPFEGNASVSEEVAEITESASQDNNGNILIGTSQDGIDADLDEISTTVDPKGSEEPSEINKWDNKSKTDKSTNYPLHRRRGMTDQPSLPYYRQPKPDFFEYTKRLSEKLNPSITPLSFQDTSSSSNVVLEEFHKTLIQASPQLEMLQSNDVPKRIVFSPRKKSLGLNNLSTSERIVPDLIILDDYEPSSHNQKSHLNGISRPKGLKIPSTYTTKEKSEPTPGAKYLALKEQLMEKMMLKKEASLSRRKELEEMDEENIDTQENFLDCEAFESDASISDDNSEDDSPENTVDFSKHQDLMNISSRQPKHSKVDESIEMSEKLELNAESTGRDSQESIKCFSLPSFQPGGGFSSSFTDGGTSASLFTDTADDTNDMLPDLNISGQQESVTILDRKSNNVEFLPSEGSDDKEIIPPWESLPIVEKQGSQLFDDDISAICSGKFISNNEIPWTPSSINEKVQPSNDHAQLLSPFNNILKHQLDQGDDSSDEELVRPSKKIRLSKHEKLWDSDDENEEKVVIEENRELNDHYEEKKKAIVTIDKDMESDVESDEENQSVADPTEENETEEDISESLIRKNASLKTSDLYDEEMDELAEERSKKLEIKNFFENEAELSGEECSSDENEDDLDEYMADDLVTNEILTNDEKLRKEIGAIHFKQQQDEDDQVIRQLKNDFLPEGELFGENGPRKRRYVWNNMVKDDNESTEMKSDSEEEEIENIQPDYLKWQQENNKVDLPEGDNEDIVLPKSIGLKVDILGKVSVTRCNTITSTKLSMNPMQRRGSFLNSSIGINSKFIKEFSNSPGAVTRKNFVFSALKQDNTPSSSPIMEVKNTKQTINNSIFNKI